MWMTGHFTYVRLSCCCSSTCLFSKKQVADLYKCLLLWIVCNIVHSPACLVQENGHAAVILQWEGSGDHLLHEMKGANEHSLITHTVGYFTEKVHPVDIWMTYSTKMFHRQQGAQSDSLGTSCIPTIPSSVIWGSSKFGTVQPCVKTGCLVIAWCRFISRSVIRYTMSLYVGSVEGGAGRDQWANVWGSKGRTRGEWGAESASSFPLFNVSFIHLQDMDIPTLFQPHIKNRHTLHSQLM